MLSYILYGRNDNYGYNLHKRAALSLNCMADVLSDSEDEILFVDYNTPDDFPTFPEAIQDTLTDKAKRHLRIFRVRPSVHVRFAAKTNLMALEPIARNVAVRRSNPANRWMLSTNTDMIFVPRQSGSLSEIVSNLPKGYYGIPRFELPETLWESFDRYDPQGVLSMLSRGGAQFYLNDIVLGVPSNRFDAPGDFQLIERADLFAYHGFHEGMLRGWHVDSNIAKRLYLVYAKVGDLTEQLFGYHCNHIRQVTPMHRRSAAENSLKTFVDEVSQPDVPDQANTWGCFGEEIEEIRLSESAQGIYVHALEQVLPKPSAEIPAASYIVETFGKCSYVPEHVLPFLLDLFSNAPRSWSVAWIGNPGRLFELFAEAWRQVGFSGELFLCANDGDATLPRSSWAQSMPRDSVIGTVDAFIFDFSRGDGEPLSFWRVRADRKTTRWLRKSLDNVIGAESIRIAGKLAPRRIIGINAIHNRFERPFANYVNCARTNFYTRIRHGYVDLQHGRAKVFWIRWRLFRARRRMRKLAFGTPVRS